MDVIRELPNTDHAARYDGEPMVQCFRVGDLGHVWITTAEALTVPGFGVPWIQSALTGGVVALFQWVLFVRWLEIPLDAGLLQPLL